MAQILNAQLFSLQHAQVQQAQQAQQMHQAQQYVFQAAQLAAHAPHAATQGPIMHGGWGPHGAISSGYGGVLLSRFFPRRLKFRSLWAASADSRFHRLKFRAQWATLVDTHVPRRLKFRSQCAALVESGPRVHSIMLKARHRAVPSWAPFPTCTWLVLAWARPWEVSQGRRCRLSWGILRQDSRVVALWQVPRF